MPDATHIPSWFSQRRYGEAPPQGLLCPWDVRHKKESCQQWGHGPQTTPSICGKKPPNHRESWELILVFTGRVLTRFSHRICPDGALVSREVP
eukprot:1713614-Pyramimonas_sp.AAC.2